MHGVPMEVPVKYAEIVEDEDAHRKSSSPPSPVPERWQSPSWYVPISVGTSPQRPSLSKSRRVPLVILPSCVSTWPVSKLELKKSMFKTTSLSSFAGGTELRGYRTRDVHGLVRTQKVRCNGQDSAQATQ